MLEQQKLIGNRVLLPQLDEFLLQPHAVFVGDEMKVAKLTHAHQGANTRRGRAAFPGSAGVPPAVEQDFAKYGGRDARVPRRYGRYSANCFCSFFASRMISGSLAVARKAVSAFDASR